MNYARFACLALLFWPTLAVADTRSVEVYGVGSVAVDPDIAYLEGQLYGRGETAADAQESFEKRKADFNSAINPKSFEGVEVTFEGVTTSRVPEGGDDMGMAVRVMGMAGNAAPGEPGEFVVGEKVKIAIRNLKPEESEKAQQTLVKLVDAANDAEMTFSSTAGNSQMRAILGNAGSMDYLMHFSLSDVPGARRKAMKQAIEEARKSASEMAALTEGKLGKVLQVIEVEEASASSAIETMYGITSQGEGPETSTTGLGKINVRLKLRVKFELLDQ